MTEFTCRSGGSNLNAGTLDGTNEASTTPLVTYASGSYDAATGVFTPASGNPVTDGVIAGTHWVSVSDGLASLRLPDSGRCTTPDSAPLSITGDIDIRCRVKLDDWTPSSSSGTLASQWGGGGFNSWMFQVITAGNLRLTTSVDGTATALSISSSVVTGLADGATKWVRVTLDVDNGAAGNDVKFYLSDDGSSWTQLGTTVTTAGTTSLFNSTAVVSIGDRQSGTEKLIGNVYSVEIRNGIGGAIVANPDFSTQSPGTTSFSDTAASANTWTVVAGASIVAATSAQLTALVSSVSSTTITLDATRRSGGATSGTVTLIVGGAWRGPNGTDQFPLNHVAAAVVSPRINMKNDQTYSITAGITIAQVGPGIIQGYTSTFGDQGRFTLDGGTTGTSYTLLTVNGANWQLWDFVLQNNGATSTANLMTPNQSMVIARGLFRNGRSGAFNLGNTGSYYVRDVECTALNQGSVSTSAISTNLDLIMERCYIHDNPGAGCRGLTVNSTTVLVAVFDSIFDTNGQHGINFAANGGSLHLHNCDFYANGGSGVAIQGTSGTSRLVAENCNFVLNGGYGVDASGAGQRTGRTINCGFGSGTAANTSGTVNSPKGIDELSNVTYPSGQTPWANPANGDFRVVLPEAKDDGRGTLPTAGTTTSAPVIGAAQPSSTPLSSGWGLRWLWRLFRARR